MSDTVSTHLSGDITYRDGTGEFDLGASPMLVSFTSGSGRVAYSTFRVTRNANTDVLAVLTYMIHDL